MNSELLIGAALILGPAIAVLCIGIGFFGFKPERAHAIRQGEADNNTVIIEEIRRIHIAPPQEFDRERQDRNPFYLCIHLATLGYSVSIMAGAPLPSNVASMSDLQRFTMAYCFLIGSTLVLAGASMGKQVGPWRGIFSSVHDHIAASRLGDDIRLPYTYACLGMGSMFVAAFIYAATSFSMTWGSVGGWLCSGIAVASLVKAVLLLERIQRYSRTLKAIVDRAVANLIQRGNDDLE